MAWAWMGIWPPHACVVGCMGLPALKASKQAYESLWVRSGIFSQPCGMTRFGHKELHCLAKRIVAANVPVDTKLPSCTKGRQQQHKQKNQRKENEDLN
eukprot:365394-Chlamydomonas_euryale.AAC.11